MDVVQRYESLREDARKKYEESLKEPRKDLEEFCKDGLKGLMNDKVINISSFRMTILNLIGSLEDVHFIAYRKGKLLFSCDLDDLPDTHTNSESYLMRDVEKIPFGDYEDQSLLNLAKRLKE